jgi:Ca2+-binding RTX toxin-like protein
VRQFTRTLVALVLVSQGVVASPAQAGPSCFGKQATIVGTNGNDLLSGTEAADVIVGLRGQDRIRALGGDDRICAGPGRRSGET